MKPIVPASIEHRPRRQRRRTGLYLVYRLEFKEPVNVPATPLWIICGVGAKASREHQWGAHTLQCPPRYTWYGEPGLSYTDAKALAVRLRKEWE